MDSEATQSADVFQLLTWLHTNRKRLSWIFGTAAVVGGVIGIYLMSVTHRENSASEALSELKVPVFAPDKPVPSPEPFLKVAETYAGTRAAGRAVLVAGEVFFESGKYAEAEKQFSRFIGEYGESPFRVEAMLGVAASLEAQGKKTEAAAKYKEVIDRHGGDSTIPTAKSGLARVYTAEGKPDLALKLYEEMEKSGRNDSWTSEARILAHELLMAHPELRPAPAKPAATAPAAITAPGAAPTATSSGTPLLPAVKTGGAPAAAGPTPPK